MSEPRQCVFTHSDTYGYWWVFCPICDLTLGDAVPHEQAVLKATLHEAGHK